MSNSSKEPDFDQQYKDWIELVSLQQSIAHTKRQLEHKPHDEYLQLGLTNCESRLKSILSRYFKVVE